MSGLMNTGGAPANDAPDKAEMSNTLLRDAERKVESQLTPENRVNYDKIVIAGMNVALEKGPDGILASLKDSKDPISDCAKGAVGMVEGLRKQAKGVMPLKAMVPAGTALMLKALDFADRSGIAKVGKPELIRATHIFTDTIFATQDITKQMLAQATQKVQALTQDPAAMQKIGEKAGTVQRPGAVG